MVRRVLRNEIPHTILVGTESSTDALENSLIAAYKIKHAFTIWPRIHTVRKTENLCLQENLYSNIESGFIHIIIQNIGKPKCPAIGEWLNKLGPPIRWNTAQQ